MGNIDGTVTANFVGTIAWSPSDILPGASLCDTEAPSHLAFFFKVKLTSNGLGSYGFSHLKIEMSEGDRSSLGGAQFGTRYQDCMGKTDQPSCATNFQHFIIVYARMEGYRCYAGTTPCRDCTHVRTNVKDKLRPFATNSAYCGGFKPWTVCYFPHHPTTWPHMTLVCTSLSFHLYLFKSNVCIQIILSNAELHVDSALGCTSVCTSSICNPTWFESI